MKPLGVKQFLYFVLLLVLSLALSSCSTEMVAEPETAVPVTGGASSSAATVEAEESTTTPASTAADEPEAEEVDETTAPTATARPSRTPQETATPRPTSAMTATPPPCENESEYVADVTIPDGTAVEPGEIFDKRWRIRNAGDCTWSADYELAFASGERMGASGSAPLAQEVAPGEGVELSVSFTAPTEPGTYRSNWQMVTAEGEAFGSRFYVEIVVSDLLASLQDELYFSSGGGFPSACGFVVQNRYGSAAPPPFFMEAVGPAYGAIAFLCLYGLPLDEPVELALYEPGGELISAFSFEAVAEPTAESSHRLLDGNGRYIGNAWEMNGTGLMELYIWDSGRMPQGEWYAIAGSASVRLEDAFAVRRETEDWATVGPAGTYDPLASSFGPYDRGDGIQIDGAGFDSGEVVAAGIYRGADEGSPLVFSALATAGADGRFSLVLPAEVSDSPGQYVLVLSSDELSARPDGGYGAPAFDGRVFRVEGD